MPDKIVIAVEEVKLKLEETKGNLSYAARRLGVGRSWLHKYVNEHPTVKRALEDIRESTIDNAETMLQVRMQSSDALLMFFLKTQGKRRGYTERVEHTGEDGKEIVIALVREDQIDAL